MELMSTVTAKGQTTIPSEVRKKLGLRPRQRVAYRIEGDKVVLEPAGSSLGALAGKLKDDKPAASKQEERAAYRSARAKRYTPAK